MNDKILRASRPEADSLARTDWFSPDLQPTVPGEYEAKTGGGHVFRRRWTEHGWINSVTGLVSKAPLEWRGVKPGAVPVSEYHPTLRADLQYGLYLLDKAKLEDASIELDAAGFKEIDIAQSAMFGK